jgi:hypothetical protein
VPREPSCFCPPQRCSCLPPELTPAQRGFNLRNPIPPALLPRRSAGYQQPPGKNSLVGRELQARLSLSRQTSEIRNHDPMMRTAVAVLLVSLAGSSAFAPAPALRCHHAGGIQSLSCKASGNSPAIALRTLAAGAAILAPAFAFADGETAAAATSPETAQFVREVAVTGFGFVVVVAPTLLRATGPDTRAAPLHPLEATHCRQFCQRCAECCAAC